MKISELSEHFLKDYIEMLNNRTNGELWPLQEEAVKKGLLDSKWDSFVVSAPHGCGKTLVAELATVKKIHENASAQILYLVPYKAMAREIYEKFSFLEDSPFGREIGIWTGDQAFDNETSIRRNFLVLTYELFQLMLKSDIDSVLNSDLIVIDELHFIEESQRGSRQEAAITRLLTLPEHPPVLALCSVVSNVDQVLQWLGCGDHYVSTKERMNTLLEGVVDPDNLSVAFYENGKKTHERELPVDQIEDKISLLADCCIDYLQEKSEGTKHQILIFVSTRADARKVALRISNSLKEHIASDDIDLSESEIKHLHNILDETRYSSPQILNQFKRLFSTGVAYHHAGLGRNLRSIIETQFIEKRIIALVSTTTLGVGVNLPASRVYFLETKAGPQAISPIQYRNMAGRAGRPQFQETGESIILCKDPIEMHSSLENYILNHEPLLESYLLRIPSETQGALLSWISQGVGATSELYTIISRSFGAPEIDAVSTDRINNAVSALQTFELIEIDDSSKGERYICTSLGFAVASSGIRPDDSSFLISNLKPENIVDKSGNLDRLATLFFICLTSRFDGSYVGFNIGDNTVFNAYLAKVNRSARTIALASRNRIPNAFYIATLLDLWISGESLESISKLMREDGSGDELIERLVPSSVEMLQYYIEIAERCSPENIGTNEDIVVALRTLCDCLELGTDNDRIELARLLRRKENHRELVKNLNSLGISTPNELLQFPYEDFSEEEGRMSNSDFYAVKARALLLIENIEERKVEYVRLLSKHRSVYDETIEQLLAEPQEFEEGVRSAIDEIAKTWSQHLDVRQVRDTGAGSNLPRPESYLVPTDTEERAKFCFEAKIQQNGTPIVSHEKALSVLMKCRGDSTHYITIGWPSFDKSLNDIARDRSVTLVDASTFALVYIWSVSKFLSVGKFLSAFDRKGNLQPDIFDSRVPRWWPSTRN